MATKESLYLIKIVATQQGVEAVKKSLKEIEGIQKTSSSTLSEATNKQNDFIKALRRVAIVVPVWFLFRQTMMAVMNTISDGIQTWMDLNKEMGRVATATRGTSTDLMNLERAIITYSASATRGFKEVASAVYALGSAGLTVTQQMAGFKHIMDLSIGTLGNTEEIAKLVAGMFNVFGDSIEGAYTESAKFQRIADVLAYTYAKEQVEVSEIASAMSYVASVGDILNIRFEELIGTIGFLNTSMLKGSKAGTSLMNAFVELASKSDQLADLGIIFDPEKPLNFLNVMEQLHNVYGKSTFSLSQLQELFSVFGNRGARAIALIISRFEEWKKSITFDRDEVENFAEYMKERFEKTLPGSIEKFKNAWRSSFITAIETTEPTLSAFFNYLAEKLEESRVLAIYGRFIPPEIKMPSLQQFFMDIAPITGLISPKIKDKEWLEANKELLELMLQVIQVTSEEEQKKKDILTLDQELNNLVKERIATEAPEITLRADIYNLVKKRVNIDALSIEQQTKLLDILSNMVNLKKEEQQLEKLVRGKCREETKLEVEQALELLKIKGATTRQILETQNTLYYVYKIEQGRTDRLKRVLDIEREITKEKLGQIEYSQDAIELYKIAMDYGESIASDIARVLAGTMKIEDLGKMAGAVFEERFPRRIEQYQVGKWIREEAPRGMPIPGIPQINIAEIMADIARTRPELWTPMHREKKPITAEDIINIDVDFNVTNNLDGKKLDGLIDTRVEKKIKLDVENPKSTFFRGTEEIIEKY